MKLLLQVLLVISLALSHASGEPTCPTLEGVSLSREVFKEGYHRDLTTSLRGNITRSGSEIRLLLVETFPPGFYIDQYELANLKSFGGPETQILEAVDVEKPAHLSEGFNFFIFIESTDAVDAQFVASVSLPIHLRYQQPQTNGDRKSSVLPNPAVAVRCDGEATPAESDNYIRAPCDATAGSLLCYWQKITVQFSSEPLTLTVPVGQQNHMTVVIFGTFLTISIFTLLLLLTMCTSNNFVKKDE